MGFRLIPLLAVPAALVAACAGDVTGMIAVDGAGAADAGALPRLAWLSPAEGAAIPRDELDELGALVARVDARLAATGVAHVELWLGDELAPRAVLDAEPYAAELQLAGDGITTLRATGLDADGRTVATASVTIAVQAPAAADCYAWLDLYQLDYLRGPARGAVAAPVTLAMPINGVGYRYLLADAPRTSLLMDCELGLALARAAPLLRARGVTEVLDLGVFNDRCIGNEGTPPDCPRGLSQHALARAIDIAALVTDASAYSVEDDWVIDADDEPTCTADTETPADAFLHELICAMQRDGIWNVALTPNYDAGHRNHFHVDLTEGSDFIRKRRGDTVPVLHEH